MESNFDDSFKDHLINNYLAKHSQRIKVSHYFELIDFLTQNQIIPKKVVRMYSVLNEYKYLYEEKRYKNKTRLVKAISQKFELHENTVWNIVKDHSCNFEPIEELEMKNSR